MTTSFAAVAQMPTELSAEKKHRILESILAALQKRFYAPEKLNADWLAAVQRHRATIEFAPTTDALSKP